MSEDLISYLRVRDADPGELQYVLMSCIRGRASHTGGQLHVLHGSGSDGGFALKVLHDPNTGAIVDVEAGPGLTPELLRELKENIERDLTETCGETIGRAILLAESPIEGYFRYRDKLQIVPVPRSAPRVVSAPGKSAHHPMVLEMRFSASRNPVINLLRSAKISQDASLALGAFLRGSVRLSTGDGRFHWVHPSPSRANSRKSSVLLKEGYQARAIPSTKFLRKFSNTSPFQPLREVVPTEYYALEPWSPTAVLMIPANLTEQFDSHFGLGGDERARWLRACYWFQHSNFVRSYSHSAAFAALLICADALIPEDPAKHRKVQKFEPFVSSLLKGIGFSKQTLQGFYTIRSHILHGNRLEYSDSEMAVGLTPEMLEGWHRFDEMRRVAKLLLVRWLATRNGRFTEEAEQEAAD